MNMKKFFGSASSGYSLLELIATVTVLVALATVMLPSVTVNKKSIYNTTETYNLSGTQRYLEMFNSLYKGSDGTLGEFNCYPNTFSTGFASFADPTVAGNITPGAGRLSLDTISLLSNGEAQAVTPNVANVDTTGDTAVITCNDIRLTATAAPNPAENIVDPRQLTVANAISLYKAGITTLNYGLAGNFDFTAAATVGLNGLDALDNTGAINTATTDYATNLTYVIKYSADTANANGIASIPYGCSYTSTAANEITEGVKNITLLGYDATAWGANLCNQPGDDIVYLFVTPNMNWTTYHADAKYTATGAVLDFSFQIEKPSTVQVPIPATSPWMPVDSYRYYIAVFDVNAGYIGDTVTGTAVSLPAYAGAVTDPLTIAALKNIKPAKLLGILSPSNLSTATP